MQQKSAFPLGVVQKLRWQDFGIFWPPTYPWLTFLKDFLSYYVVKSTYRWHFPYHLPTSSCQRSFWMTPYSGWLIFLIKLFCVFTSNLVDPFKWLPFTRNSKKIWISTFMKLIYVPAFTIIEVENTLKKFLFISRILSRNQISTFSVRLFWHLKRLEKL